MSRGENKHLTRQKNNNSKHANMHAPCDTNRTTLSRSVMTQWAKKSSRVELEGVTDKTKPRD